MRITAAIAKQIGDKLRVNWQNVDPEEFRIGLEVEQEHGGGPEDWAKTALDHLEEGRDYYSKLVAAEKKMHEPKGKLTKALDVIAGWFKKSSDEGDSDSEPDLNSALDKLYGSDDAGSDGDQLEEDAGSDGDQPDPEPEGDDAGDNSSDLLSGLSETLRAKLQRGEPGTGKMVALTHEEMGELLAHGAGGIVGAGKNEDSPTDAKLNDQQIAARFAQLKKNIAHVGLKFVVATGAVEGAKATTDQIVVPDMTREEAVAVGEKFSQSTVGYFQGGRMQTVHVTGEHTGKKYLGGKFEPAQTDDGSAPTSHVADTVGPQGRAKMSLTPSQDEIVKSVVDTLAKAQRLLHGKMQAVGMDVSVENRRGSIREWINKDTGESGATRMEHPYGYFKGTLGVDGDHLDCFVGPWLEAPDVHVITTMKGPDFVDVDEQKCMVGFPDARTAKRVLIKHYDDPRYFGSMESWPVEEFKAAALANKGKLLKREA